MTALRRTSSVPSCGVRHRGTGRSSSHGGLLAEAELVVRSEDVVGGGGGVVGDAEAEREERIRKQQQAEDEAYRAAGKRRPLRLYGYDELPEYLKDNEFIRTGYRAFYSYSDNFRSMFMLHNETGNIWTHLLGLVLFVALMVYVQYSLPAHAPPSDRIMFAAYFLCACACLLFSTLFHTHFCHSKHAYVQFGCLDYAGISALICGSCCLVTYYGFYCNDLPRNTWITLTIMMASVGVFGPCYPQWSHASFRKWRTLIYVLSGICSSIPVFHFLLRDGFPDVDVSAYYGWALMLFLYLGGACIYAFRIPERWAPGKFDIFLHSHQFWHVCVVGACFAHYVACRKLMEWRLNREFCPTASEI